MQKLTSEAALAFDWNQAKALLALADEGSLSAAARMLGQTQPTIGRQISALEDALGVTLVERTGRSVHLTRGGIELLDHVRAMASGADRVALSASGQSQSVEGQVRITASEMTSAHILPPILKALGRTAPKLEIDVVADSGLRDLVRREADIAIRHARPEQPNLMAKRVRDETMRFFASPAYLKVHGEPDPASLAGHQIIGNVDTERMLGYLRPLGLDLTQPNFRFTSSSQIVAWEMARAGLGMMIMTDRIAAQFSDMKPVLTDLAPFSIPTWLVTHSELRTSRRIRLVFDHLAEHLA